MEKLSRLLATKLYQARDKVRTQYGPDYWHEINPIIETITTICANKKITPVKFLVDTQKDTAASSIITILAAAVVEIYERQEGEKTT